MLKRVRLSLELKLALKASLFVVTLLWLPLLMSCGSANSMSGKSAKDNSTAASASNQSAAASSSSEAARSANEKQAEGAKVVNFHGVSFNYSSLLASQVEAKEEAAIVLQQETDKPDSTAPNHLAFRLKGPYASAHEASFFSPEIRVYPLAEYRQVLSVSKEYVRQFDDEVKLLGQLLSAKPASFEKQLPFLPYGVNGHQAFQARLKYVSFTNGEGILFLTQYNIEPSLINNQGLAYVFQGITNDKKYYVSATFPVSAAFLPKDFDAESFEGYQLPEYFFDAQNQRSNEKQYHEYVLKVKDRLDKLPPSDYEPRLTLFEELISSLKIEM